MPRPSTEGAVSDSYGVQSISSPSPSPATTVPSSLCRSRPVLGSRSPLTITKSPSLTRQTLLTRASSAGLAGRAVVAGTHSPAIAFPSASRAATMPGVSGNSAAAGRFHAPTLMTTSAVIVQTTSVSMNGSSPATTPSRTGSSVLAALWAIGAEPCPASFEKSARFMPQRNA